MTTPPPVEAPVESHAFKVLASRHFSHQSTGSGLLDSLSRGTDAKANVALLKDSRNNRLGLSQLEIPVLNSTPVTEMRVIRKASSAPEKAADPTLSKNQAVSRVASIIKADRAAIAQTRSATKHT